MKKLLLVLISLVVLSGCGDDDFVRVEADDWDAGLKVCSDAKMEPVLMRVSARNEYASCGFRCATYTGWTSEIHITCSNGDKNISVDYEVFHAESDDKRNGMWHK